MTDESYRGSKIQDGLQVISRMKESTTVVRRGTASSSAAAAELDRWHHARDDVISRRGDKSRQSLERNGDHCDDVGGENYILSTIRWLPTSTPVDRTALLVDRCRMC